MDYSKMISQKVSSLRPAGLGKYMRLIGDCISLGVGEPDFATPERIRQAALQELSTGRIHYTPINGLQELRELVLQYLDVRFGLKGYTADSVLITVGASQAIDLAIRTVVNPGDEVIVLEPTYIAYIPSVVFAGGVPVVAKTHADDKFKLRPEELRKVITPKTKAILLPYPNNPTGAIMEKEDLEAIAEVLRETDILVISDEIYAELTYNGKRHVSIASLPGMQERTIVLNGFSKAFSMTGWRLGYAVGPDPLIVAMAKIHEPTMLCAPRPAQVAGIAAIRQGLEDGWQDTTYMMQEYDKRRRYFVNALNDLGLICHDPEGAFYAFPSIQSTGLTSEEFCDRLLEEENVAVIPGSAFGPEGEGFVRCCYASSMDHLEKAVERIGKMIRRIKC